MLLICTLFTCQTEMPKYNKHAKPKKVSVVIYLRLAMNVKDFQISVPYRVSKPNLLIRIEEGSSNSLCSISTEFQAIIYGPTGAGKSKVIAGLLEAHQEITSSKLPPTVIYAYKEVPPEPLKGISLKLHQGLPHVSDILGLRQKDRNLVLICDDLMESLATLVNDELHEWISLITEHSRKSNISIIVTVQQLFVNSEVIRTLKRNLTFLVLFPFPADESGVLRLLRQICPSRCREVLDGLYIANTKAQFSAFLFCDLHPHSKNTAKIRTFVYPRRKKVPNDPLAPAPLYIFHSGPKSWQARNINLPTGNV